MLSSRLLVLLVPLLPLLGSLTAAILGPRWLRHRSHWPVILTCVASFVASLFLAAHVRRQLLPPTDAPPAATATGTATGTGTGTGYEELHTLWTWAWVSQTETVPSALPLLQHSSPEPQAPRLTHPDFRVDVTLRADPLSAIMLVMVTLIGSLVAIYSAGYMHGDRGYWRYFAYLGLFVFAMTMLVSVSNFLLLYVFWEGVGVCSYLLIGFWYDKPAAAAAGKKAFLVNRIGDTGLAFALFLIWIAYGTWNFHDTAAAAGVLGPFRLADGVFVGGATGLAICLLLLLGACGKSAQFPLHVWLPDAMEGPTPVSALIHAATMVTAGIYLIARCSPLFLVSPTAQLIVALIGGGTALLAALIALTQFDLKRVLAYSTISQLGFMFLALGTGTLAGVTAAMFHLFTHAFFKALLFLGAGSVMHAMGGVVDMRRFGGLRRRMPVTHWTFALGCLALAGLYPLSGFWSKDAILGSVRDQAQAMQAEIDARSAASADAAGQGGAGAAGRRAAAFPAHAARPSAERLKFVAATGVEAADAPAPDHGHASHAIATHHLQAHTAEELKRGAAGYRGLYYMALITAMLTAFYTFRAFFLTFYGPERVPHEAGHHAHESPATMWVPLSVLAAFALVIGVVLEKTHLFANFLGYTPSLASPAMQATPAPGLFHLDIAVTSSLLVLGSIGLAAFFYLGDQSEISRVARLLDSRGLGRPYRWSLGKFYFDELYQWLIVIPCQACAALCYFVDRHLVDGLVNAVGRWPGRWGQLFRRLQLGILPFYSLAMVLGMLTLLAARALFGNQ